MEDPVGSTPHVGRTQIGRFYDTFIGPREIGFESTGDFVSRSTVVRDVVLHVRMGPAVTLAIPAVLCYQLRPVKGELKIDQLQAYWELPPMVLQFLRNGAAALPAAIGLARAMLANQGAAGALGFSRGFRRPGRAARRVVGDLLTALSAGDELAVRRLLGRAGAGTNLAELAQRLDGAHPHKIIAAGRSVTVSLTAGRDEPRGVLIADFGEGAALDRLRFYG